MVGARVGLAEPLSLLYDSPRWSMERDRLLSSEGATMVVSKVYQASLSLTGLVWFVPKRGCREKQTFRTDELVSEEAVILWRLIITSLKL